MSTEIRPGANWAVGEAAAPPAIRAVAFDGEASEEGEGSAEAEADVAWLDMVLITC